VGEVFAKRGVGADQLPAGAPTFLPLDEAAEVQRAKTVGEQFAVIALGLVGYTRRQAMSGSGTQEPA